MGVGWGCQESARSAGLSFFAQKACLIVSLWPVQVPGCGWGQAWSRAVSFHVPSAMSLTCRGVAFSFLFAAPLILLVFATFLVGGNVQTLVCRSWESGELYEVGLGLLQLRGSQESESEGSGSQRCRQERGTEGRKMRCVWGGADRETPMNPKSLCTPQVPTRTPGDGTHILF